MRKITIHVAFACTTMLLGVILSQAFQLLQKQSHPADPLPYATPSPSPDSQIETPPDPRDDEYPESNDLTPSEITWFIESHPQANLKRLWERLRVKPESDSVRDFSSCGHCRAEMTDYDLDNEWGDESLVKISDHEVFRYLVFKHGEEKNDWKLLGHVDAWGKYRESQAFVLLSGGWSWLAIRGQSASGSGVAFYNTQIFEVTSKSLNFIVFYQSEGYQSGFEGWPTKAFTSRILSCENINGRKQVTVEFNIDYSGSTPGNKEPLFSKRQIAEFLQSSNADTQLDPKHSTVTNRELDHVYNVDSMTDLDFLQYNYSELEQLARQGNKAQRTWLKSYLKEYATNSEQQRKLRALVK
jgi:hypothetical protein